MTPSTTTVPSSRIPRTRKPASGSSSGSTASLAPTAGTVVADDQGEARAVQRPTDGLQLLKHRLEVTALLHHPEHPGQLALGALDPVDDGAQVEPGGVRRDGVRGEVV